MAKSVGCYLVRWETFAGQAASHRTAKGIDWFYEAAESGEPWVVPCAALIADWESSGHRWTETGLTYDDIREALAAEERTRLDSLFHTLLPSSESGVLVVELGEGVVGCSGAKFYAAVSPRTVAGLWAVTEGLGPGVLWPAFRDVLGEDDDPPPDAGERLAADFEEFWRYVGQWVAALRLASERGWGLVVP